MVIHNFDIFRSKIGPTETNAPLIVDTDTVLSSAVPAQCFKAIARGNPQVFKLGGDFKLSDFTPGHLGNIRKSPTTLAERQLLRMFAFEGVDHASIMTPDMHHVKHDESQRHSEPRSPTLRQTALPAISAAVPSNP